MPPAITLIEAQEQLSEWLKASRATATGLEYTIKGRQLIRNDGAEIRQQINYWTGIVSGLQAGKSKSIGGVRIHRAKWE